MAIVEGVDSGEVEVETIMIVGEGEVERKRRRKKGSVFRAVFYS